MIFHSAEFILCLSVAVAFYHLAPVFYRKHLLLLYSYLFYFTWSIPYSFLLFFVSTGTYILGLRIEKVDKEEKKKQLVFAGVVGLLSFLSIYKYLGFFSGLFPSGPISAIHLLIPVGISYYVFKLISYIVDIYWEKIPAQKDFVSFAAFTAFFPQILCGPIQRPGHFFSQIQNLQSNPDLMVRGLRLMLFGFFKKLVIADRLAIFVDQVYAAPDLYSAHVVLMACYFYVFQLYADFSGLTDIAIGIGRLFGIESPKNFDSPFYSPNIQAFWRRWHMSLTSWLGDYLFTPLRMRFRHGGDKGLALCIAINMIAIGIWHGAKATYLIFGIIHAIYMVVSVFTLKKRDAFFARHPRLQKIRKFEAPLITFHLWVFASVFFRAESLQNAWAMIENIFAMNFSRLGIFFFGKKELLFALTAILFMECVHLIQTHRKLDSYLYNKPIYVRWSVYYAMVFCILILGQFTQKEFIYFQF